MKDESYIGFLNVEEVSGSNPAILARLRKLKILCCRLVDEIYQPHIV